MHCIPRKNRATCRARARPVKVDAHCARKSLILKHVTGTKPYIKQMDEGGNQKKPERASTPQPAKHPNARQAPPSPPLDVTTSGVLQNYLFDKETKTVTVRADTLHVGDVHHHHHHHESDNPQEHGEEMEVEAKIEPYSDAGCASTILKKIQDLIANYPYIERWQENERACRELSTLFQEQGHATLTKVMLKSVHFFVRVKFGPDHDAFLRACRDGTLSRGLTKLLVTPELEEAAGVKLRVRLEMKEPSNTNNVSAQAEMALEAGCDEVDARVSIHQPEVKLDEIMMADLTVKDSIGGKCAFHEKKARDHGGWHLGGGSFGEVYKAVHAVHGDVAVKLAKPGKENRDLLVMYQKEAGKHVLALTSDRIVSIKGFVQCEDDACDCGLIGIVMEYMKHGSLWDFRISKWQDRPDLWPLTNRMVYQISSGMLFLHSKKIIHRDLKLENVLVDGNLHAKVADLGLATDRQTSSGDKCWGTHSHMPPEAFRTDLSNATKVITPKYDVYSFAMTLYELLTGIHPYSDRGFDMLRLLKVHSKQSPCLLPVPVSTPEDLIRVMEKSWSYEPNKRPNFEEITDWVAKLDTNPTYESLGRYLAESNGNTAIPITETVTQNPVVGQESHPTHLGQNNVVAPPEIQHSQPSSQDPSKPSSFGPLKSHDDNLQPTVKAEQSMEFKESPAVAASQPSSTERDPTIIFDSSQPCDEEFEIKVKVRLNIQLRAAMASKLDQILICLERCKHRDYWDSNSSLSTIFSFTDITLKSLKLPAKVDEDDFTLYLRVCNKRDLDKLHELSEKGHLRQSLYGFFVDVHLKEVCLPGEPDLKVESWEEQFNKGTAHFQKKEKANESKKSDSERSESRQKQLNRSGASFTQTNCSGATQINTGKVKITMNSAPHNMIIGDQYNYYNHYRGSKGAEAGEGAGGHYSGRQPQKKKQEKTKLCESREKVSQQTLLDIEQLIPGNAVKSLGRHLGLEDVRVESIVYANRHETSSETAYQVLREWLQQKGRQATKAVLANALWEANCYDAAKSVR